MKQPKQQSLKIFKDTTDKPFPSSASSTSKKNLSAPITLTEEVVRTVNNIEHKAILAMIAYTAEIEKIAMEEVTQTFNSSFSITHTSALPSKRYQEAIEYLLNFGVKDSFH